MEKGLDGLETELNEDMNERLEEMAEQGVIELEKPKEKVEKPVEKPIEPKESEDVEVFGVKRTIGEIEKAFKVLEKETKFDQANTQRAQDLAREKADLDALRDKLSKTRKDSDGDESVSNVLDVLETVVNDTIKIKEQVRIQQEAIIQGEARKNVEKMRDDANAEFKKLNIDFELPPVDSPEFEKFRTVGMRANPLFAAALKLEKDKFVSKGKTKDKADLSTVSDNQSEDDPGEEDKEGYNADQKKFASKMGVKI